MHLEQLVDLRSSGDGKRSAPGVDPIVLPKLRPFLCGFDELNGEALSVRKSLLGVDLSREARSINEPYPKI
jgi:hypothetical protein